MEIIFVYYINIEYLSCVCFHYIYCTFILSILKKAGKNTGCQKFCGQTAAKIKRKESLWTALLSFLLMQIDLLYYTLLYFESHSVCYHAPRCHLRIASEFPPQIDIPVQLPENSIRVSILPHGRIIYIHCHITVRCPCVIWVLVCTE